MHSKEKSILIPLAVLGLLVTSPFSAGLGEERDQVTIREPAIELVDGSAKNPIILENTTRMWIEISTLNLECDGTVIIAPANTWLRPEEIKHYLVKIPEGTRLGSRSCVVSIREYSVAGTVSR